MKKTIWVFVLSLVSLSIIGQVEKSVEIKMLFEANRFDELISSYDSSYNDYSAKELYYFGMAHYMKEEDRLCIKFMDKAIKENKKDPSPHYIKGNTLNYMGEYEKAISSFKNAIELNDTLSEFYSGIGESYSGLNKLEKSIEYFKLSTQLKNPSDRSFVMIALNYNALNKSEEALQSFYVAKEKISKESAPYQSVLYNIGLAELLSKNYVKAEKALNELVEINPTDFMAYSKLIQIYYAQKEYNKAIPLKQRLYEAHEKGLLNGNLKNMFCFDQFYWNGRLIQVWERFAEPKDEIYYKHVFYVLDKKGEIDYRIQTESTIVFDDESDLKYILGMNKGDMHGTFNIGFVEDFKYDDLKKSVIDVLDGKIVPTSTTRPTRN